MFIAHQLRNWTSPHLHACPWYLECNFGATPLEEKALVLSLKDAMEVAPLMDEFAGLDPDACAKAMKRKELADKKKQGRLDDAERKNEENTKRKTAAQAERDVEKARKKALKRKPHTPTQNPTTSAAETSSSFSLTQEQLLHGLMPAVQIVDPPPHVDKCILNVSLESLIDNEKAFDDVLLFLDMVIIHIWHLRKIRTSLMPFLLR